MTATNRREFLQTASLAALAAGPLSSGLWAAPTDDWKSLFDGKTLKGWHKSQSRNFAQGGQSVVSKTLRNGMLQA